LHDRSGHVLRVVCRSSGDVIAEGCEVVVIDADSDRLVVDVLDLGTRR
jgi:hypothetical protein